MKKLLRVLAVVLAGVFTGVALPEAEAPQGYNLEKLAQVLKEGAPAFTREQANAYAQELIPLVEEAAGRKLKLVPAIRLVNREELARVLARELQPQLKNLLPKLKEVEVKRAAQAQAQFLAPVLLGKYGTEDKVLYLLPRNLHPLLKLLRMDEKHSVSIVKLVIAHELTHALQDQEVGLQEKFCQVKGLDESQAVNATIEGHAVFIQYKVGQALKLGETVREYSKLLAAGAVKFEDPALELLNQRISAQFEQIYLGGKKFVEYHHKKGGNELIWRILAAPPVETSMIAAPETYSPVRKERPDYAKLLEGLEKEFGERDWVVRNVEMGQMMLRSSYAGLDASKREEMVSKLVHGQALIVVCPSPQAAGYVLLLVLKDPAYLPKFIATVEEQARRNVEKVKTGSVFKIENLRIGDFPGIQADVSRKVCFNIAGPGEAAVKQVLVRICRGKVMLEILDANIGLSDAKIIAIAEEVFQRYNSMVGR